VSWADLVTSLHERQPNALCGILPDSLVTVVNARGYSSETLELTYEDLQAVSLVNSCSDPQQLTITAAEP
jgi:hypothetical protein